MPYPPRQTAQLRLQQLQARIQQWRETRQKHSAMPAELWAEATGHRALWIDVESRTGLTAPSTVMQSARFSTHSSSHSPTPTSNE